ncbi:NCS2 family permease [bacterium]|nr:NCS2 family permease [bacterium]
MRSKDSFFYAVKHLNEYNSSFKKEILAGFTTFLTMSYIIVVNPQILSATGMSYNGILTATILVSFLSTVLMGLYANLPYALAPGMGINAFFTYTLVINQHIPWQDALGAVFISGLIFIVLSLFKIREEIVKAIPRSLRFGVAAGIGLFIAFIGFKNAGFIVSDPATYISRGPLNVSVLLFLIGLLITIFLILKKVKGALLLGIITTTLLAIPFKKFIIPDNIISSPDFSSVFFKLHILKVLKLSMIAPIFTFLFTDMFDSISAFIGISNIANMTDENGQPKNVGKALLVDAISTTVSGLFGTSSGTTYIESASGVEEGGRTGLTAITTGLLFLPFLFIANFLKAIPPFATAPALVIVGVYMMQGVSSVDFKNLENGIPAFLALILIPLTYSITQGIIWAFIAYTLIKVLLGKYRELSPMMYIIFIFSILALIF